MNMKTAAKAIMLAVAVSMSWQVSADEQISSRTIKWGHLLAETHIQSDAIKRFGEIVKEKTDAKIAVREFPSSQLGSEGQQQSALQANIQEMMSGATTTLVGMIPEFGVLDFPFLVTNYDEVDALLGGPVGDALLQRLPDHGFVGLAFFENGFRNITNNRGPVQAPEDISGLKIRVMENPIYLDTFSRLGANPVPLAFGELFTALETGTIDAQENPLGIILSNRFFEVQKFMTMSAHSYNTNIVLVSKKFWDQLSYKEQEILKGAALEAAEYLKTRNRAEADAFRAELEAAGMKVNDLSGEALDEMREITAPVIERYLSSYDPEFVTLVNAELGRIRSAK